MAGTHTCIRSVRRVTTPTPQPHSGASNAPPRPSVTLFVLRCVVSSIVQTCVCENLCVFRSFSPLLQSHCVFAIHRHDHASAMGNRVPCAFNSVRYATPAVSRRFDCNHSIASPYECGRTCTMRTQNGHTLPESTGVGVCGEWVCEWRTMGRWTLEGTRYANRNSLVREVVCLSASITSAVTDTPNVFSASTHTHRSHHTHIHNVVP